MTRAQAIETAARKLLKDDCDKHGESRCPFDESHGALWDALALPPDAEVEKKVERQQVWWPSGYLSPLDMEGPTLKPIRKEDGWQLYAERPLPQKSRAEELADKVDSLREELSGSRVMTEDELREAATLLRGLKK